jgi:hypothetical protein
MPEVPDLVTYPREYDKREFQGGKIVITETAGTPLPLFVRREYADFIKDPRNRAQSRNMAVMLHTWAQVAPAVIRLNIPFNNYEKAGKHPNVLGRGSNKAAFAFKAPVDGVEKDLVAIVDHAPDNRSAQAKIKERVANLALVKGRGGFEQGVAWSNEPPVVVAEQAPGKSFDKVGPEEKAAIPAEHWDKLISDVDAVADLGVALDPMLENFFYSSQAGFTVIDIRRCAPSQEADTHRRNLEHIRNLRNTAIAA